MREQSQEIKTLFQKYLNGRCSTEELDRLLEFFKLESNDELQELISTQFEKAIPDGVDAVEVDNVVNRIHSAIMHDIGTKPSRPVRKLLRTVLAMVSILFMILGISLYLNAIKSKKPEISNSMSAFGMDVSPRDKSAYITFSNGRQLKLDANKEGLMTENGTFKYMDGDELTGTDVDYATVSTPMGGTYQVTLPDGSKAWLNAQSSIRYPSVFDETERSVQIEGEIYLEVSPDSKRPFIVRSSNQRIEVLGTAFNVRAGGEGSTTTLVHGKVALTNSSDGSSYVLKAGDQAKLVGSRTSISKVDTYDYVAWKDGIIFNRNASLRETCVELERWYDVKFVFPKDYSNTGKGLNSINRTEMLSSVLNALKNTYEVDFEIKGKEVFVR